MEIKFTDNSIEILTEAMKAKRAALEAVGMKAEGYAKRELTEFPAVDTGRLRNSITHATKMDAGKTFSYKDSKRNEYLDKIGGGDGADDDAVYIGTNVEYGKWIENGTGIYASDGQGKKDSWVYYDDEGSPHLTGGHRAVHFLKKAATEHSDEYREIVEKKFKNV